MVLLPVPLLVVEPVSLLPVPPLGAGVDDEALPAVPLPGWSPPALLLLEPDGGVELLRSRFMARPPLALDEPGDGSVVEFGADEAELELDESGVERAIDPGADEELPDCDSRRSSFLSQPDSAKDAATAAASVMAKNLCCMFTISSR